jgi:hypothetical protein
MAIHVSLRSNIPQRRAPLHLTAPSSSPPFFAAMPGLRPGRSHGRRNGLRANQDRKGPTVKNGEETYLECLGRCARGLRAADVAAPLRRPTRATVRCAPPQARRAARGRRSASGSDIVQRRTCNGNVND